MAELEPAGTESLLTAGREALRCGEWQTAREHFEHHLAIDEHAVEAWEGLADACYWLQDTARLFDARQQAYQRYRARGDVRSAARVAVWLGAGRGEAARAQARAAIELFERLGASRHAEHVRALLDQIREGASTREASRAGGPLTQRQREVLRFVAQGLSDREIAAQLFLSEFTVHRHVANILDRLGVSSRAAAVAAALRQNLV